jgi:plasmid replication initiation protein
MQKNGDLSLNFKIERSNELNAFRPKNMSLTELRFLAIYQSKINARNPNTRAVKFSLKEFCRIMDIHQMNVTHIKKVADDIICKPVHLPSDMSNNGFMVIPLFNECNVYQNKKTNEWEVKIECHPKVLPYMFEMRKNYFTYKLWNALKLKSVNQIRMYENLKQYEKIGQRVIELDELKSLLGIEKNQYSLFKDFRVRVIEPCQVALEEHTDIKFTYETIRSGRKITALKFTITKNENFKDDLRLKEFISDEDLADIIGEQHASKGDNPRKDACNVDGKTEVVDSLDAMYLKCNEAYTKDELRMLMDYIKNSGIKLHTSVENYIYSIYCKVRIEGSNVNNMFKYTFSIIESQINSAMFGRNESKGNNTKNTSNSLKENTNYDLDEFKRFVHSTKRIMHD